MQEMRIVFSDDLFYRNFRHLKAQYCLSRMAMSKLLGISVYTVEVLEKKYLLPWLPLAYDPAYEPDF